MNREEGRELMREIVIFMKNKDLESINQLLKELDPEKDCFRKFTSVIRPTFSIRKYLIEWRPAVDRFYRYHQDKNTKDFDSYFIGLND